MPLTSSSVTKLSLPRRLAALGTLVALVVVIGLFISLLVTNWLALVIAAVALILLVTSVVRAVVLDGRHRRRWTGLALIGLVALVAALVVVAFTRPLSVLALVVVLVVAGLAATYARQGYLRRTSAPTVVGRRVTTHSRKRVLFLNPMSGGGKVGQFDLVEEAQRRGVETVMLRKEDDLTDLVRRAIDDGAQVVGMAGGDGSQADVASVAVAADIPFVCIPAGTRNHFALDLNLDRNDPRSALDAFTEGVEVRVDYGLAGERFFVNNVSLGVYPYVVDDPAYRDGRLKAAATLIPTLLDPERPRIDLRFASPSGQQYTTAQVLLVSNNPYRAAGVDGIGRRISLEGGELGVIVVAAQDADELAAAARQLVVGTSLENVAGCDQWTTPRLRVTSDDAEILVGVDGEAMRLPSPLDLRIVPRGLRLIVPVDTPQTPRNPGPLLSAQALGGLWDIAGGVEDGPYGDDL